MAKIKIRHGDHEIEIDGPDEFIEKQLEAFYEKVGPVSSASSGVFLKNQLLSKPSPKKSKVETPAEFYKSKGKTDGISQILIFGKYLEEYKGVTQFSRGDINKIAKEAKVAKDVHSQYFTNAVKQGLLRTHSGGRYSLTLSAEDVLASM